MIVVIGMVNGIIGRLNNKNARVIRDERRQRSTFSKIGKQEKQKIWNDGRADRNFLGKGYKEVTISGHRASTDD